MQPEEALPRLLAPRIEATTTEASHGMHVQVKIGSALLGWMLTYEGLMSPEEAAAQAAANDDNG